MLTKIRDIPTGSRDEEAWDVINAEYDAAIDDLLGNLDEYVQVWRTT